MHASRVDKETGQPPSRHYREAKHLHPTLLDLCTTHIEEGLYSQGFALLFSALTSDTASSAPSLLPPAYHLSFVATLIVHPQLTTRTTSPDKHAASNDALRYLRDVNTLVGPRNAHLDEAFHFPSDHSSPRAKRARKKLSDITSPDVNDSGSLSAGQINSTYASTSSLWTAAGDFWSVVGWAFNCSIHHPERWRRWKLLLDLLLAVLADDFDLRLPSAQSAYQSGGTAATQISLKECLFTKYLSPIGQGRNNKRRLMRAIFADGSPKALAEFGEIWRHEAKPPKQKHNEPWRKRKRLDLENDDFGDYLVNSEEESPVAIRRSHPVTAIPPSRRSSPPTDIEDKSGADSSGVITPNTSPTSPGTEAFGGMESIHVRQRILALLMRYCSFNPDEFLDTEDLFDLYTEFLRPLPLPIFQHFCLPSKPYLTPLSQTCLNQMLLRPLLAATAPPYSEAFITQAAFEEHYAPHAANNVSAVDNAKVSLLVESLLRSMWNTKALRVSTSLRRKVERGIAARREKGAGDGKKRTGTGIKARADEEAVQALQASGERMLMVLDMNIL